MIIEFNKSIGSKNNLATPLSEFLGVTTIAIFFLWRNLVLVENPRWFCLSSSNIGIYILTPNKAISKASYSVKNGLAAAEREVLEVKTNHFKENAIDKKYF
jgi:subfamily B ATP-binding cassette protein MsbA